MNNSCEGRIRTTHIETGEHGVIDCSKLALFRIQGSGEDGQYHSYSFCPRCLHLALSSNALVNCVIHALPVDTSFMFDDMVEEFEKNRS